ncbi:MAG: hypothetical protein H6619_05880 [Deltaproteobacteria bacterium]|nr:hypothetical protein [Deltaproteobacteria bacterium]
MQGSKHKNPPFLFLLSLFLFFFVVPIAVIAPLINSLFNIEDFDQSYVEKEIAPSSISVPKRGSFLKVNAAEHLSPTIDKGFLVIGWFNIEDLPAEGERMILLSRYAEASVIKHGYAIALTREKGVLHPEVLWRDKNGVGAWYPFSHVEILPGYWFMTALSYYNERYLGLHIITTGIDGNLHSYLAGGHELSVPVLPENDFPLKVGSVKTGLFTGSIGPVGVFSVAKLQSKLQDILSSFSDSPADLPDLFKKSEILLWSPDGKSDESQFGHEVKLIEQKRSKSDKEDEN